MKEATLALIKGSTEDDISLFYESIEDVLSKDENIEKIERWLEPLQNNEDIDVFIDIENNLYLNEEDIDSVEDMWTIVKLYNLTEISNNDLQTLETLNDRYWQMEIESKFHILNKDNVRINNNVETFDLIETTVFDLDYTEVDIDQFCEYILSYVKGFTDGFSQFKKALESIEFKTKIFMSKYGNMFDSEYEYNANCIFNIYTDKSSTDWEEEELYNGLLEITNLDIKCSEQLIEVINTAHECFILDRNVYLYFKGVK